MNQSEGRRMQLLIVDDEANVRSAVRRVLRKEPYDLTFAGSAAEGLAACQQNRPDVIISDHLMPQMTGLEMLSRVRLLYPNVVSVLLTGQAEMNTVITAINEGAIFRFLQKPWEDDELRLVVHLATERARERTDLLELRHRIETQDRRVKQLEAELARLRGGGTSTSTPTSVARDSSGAIVISDEE